MKNKILSFVFCFCFICVYSQKKEPSFKWLRTGFVYGFSSQNTFIKQDPDYRYESRSYKFSNHFHLSKKEKHSWEILVEPSYYSSKHESFNIWHKYFTSSSNIDDERAKFLPLKHMNEYVLNLGMIYRRNLTKELSAYGIANIGPMYIDTDSERLKKGFAFSDIFALGLNYKYNHWSLDIKTMIRHVSNAETQYPNFGYNAIGFEFGTYYELK